MLQPWLTTAGHIASRPMATSFNLVLNSDGEQPPNQVPPLFRIYIKSDLVAGCFTFEAIGAGACSVRAQPVFRSSFGLTPCLSGWCFLSLRHLSAEALSGRRTQVRKWRVHCLLDRLMSLAARPFGNVLTCIWHWPYVILADWVQVMVDLGRSGGRKRVRCNDIAGASTSPQDSGRALFCFALAPLTHSSIALRASG